MARRSEIGCGERLEELERIERPSASDGERQAAEWLVERFARARRRGADRGRAGHGTYWWPLGLGAALGALGGVAALRGRRLLGARCSGALGAAGDRRRLPARAAAPAPRCCPSATTYNVVCELGDRRSRAHGRRHRPPRRRPLRPRLPPGDPADSPTALGLIEGTDTSPPLMAPVLGGPAAGGARRAQRQPGCSPSSGFVLGARLGCGDGRHRRAARSSRAPTTTGPAVVALLALARRLRRAAAGEPARDPPLDRLGGVVQRGDQGLRRAPLRRAAAREHLLPLPRDARLAAPAASCAARAS